MEFVDNFLDKVQQYIDDGLVTERQHSTNKDLFIYNYTPKTQHGKLWDEVTTVARGLIINKTERKLIARPFKKFFNYQEHIDSGQKLPDELPVIEEKYDGSLGILFFNGDVPEIATRGSFNSEQAQTATKWISRANPQLFSKDKTYLFEIIYPNNRIVVDYGNTNLLILLAVIETATGIEQDITPWYNRLAYELPIMIKYTHGNSLDKALKTIRNTEIREGFVLNYIQSGLRLKYKFEEYVRLHKIITGLSEKGVWEYLRDNGAEADLSEYVGTDNIPEFVTQFIENTAVELADGFYMIQDEVMDDFEKVKFELNGADRKEYAKRFKEFTHPDILFSMLDKKDYTDMIWKIIKPRKTVPITHTEDN